MSVVRVDELDHVAIRVSDLERSARWYEDVLGLRRGLDDSAGGGPLMIGTGTAALALFRAQSPLGGDEQRLSHIAFRTGRAAFEHARGALADSGHTPRFVDHGISHSLYFADPDDHVIELTTYEPDQEITSG